MRIAINEKLSEVINHAITGNDDKLYNDFLNSNWPLNDFNDIVNAFTMVKTIKESLENKNIPNNKIENTKNKLRGILLHMHAPKYYLLEQDKIQREFRSSLLSSNNRYLRNRLTEAFHEYKDVDEKSRKSMIAETANIRFDIAATRTKLEPFNIKYEIAELDNNNLGKFLGGINCTTANIRINKNINDFCTDMTVGQHEIEHAIQLHQAIEKYNIAPKPSHRYSASLIFMQIITSGSEISSSMDRKAYNYQLTERLAKKEEKTAADAIIEATKKRTIRSYISQSNFFNVSL